MKKFLFSAVSLILISLSVLADDSKPRVAIFDPIMDIPDIDMKTPIREIITSGVVNSGQYNTVERSLLEKVFQEQNFSNSGLVNDDNAVEIGKLTGANKVIVSLISSVASKSKGRNTFMKNKDVVFDYMMSIKIIDVKTAKIDRQKVKKISFDNWMDEVSTITNELINGSDTATSSVEERINPDTSLHNALAQNTINYKTEKNQKSEYEFVLNLEPGYTPADYTHKDNYIEVLLNGNVVGGGTLSEGFNIKIKEKKHKKYKIEIRPTSTSSDGKIDTKSGKTQYTIDTNQQQKFEFMVQSQHKGKWTIYTVRLR